MSQTVPQSASRPTIVQRQLGLAGPFPDPKAPRQNQVQLQGSSAWALLILLVVGLAMCGGGIVWAYTIWQEDPFWWFVWIFVAVLEVVGLVIVAIFFHQLLARRKVAAPEVFVSVQPVYLGETFTVRLRQSFRGHCQLNGISLKLLCREEATYRRGTSTYTDRHTVYEETHQVVEARQIQAGDVLEEELSLKIPEDAMHTFAAHWNKILWYVHVHIDIASWPDFREDFSFHVAPCRAEQTA